MGELVVERSGVLNLGVEGMMLMGAVTGFAATVSTGSPLLGIIAAAGAGASLALTFAVLTLTLMANQVATGLALTIFGIGLSALLGSSFVGMPVPALPRLASARLDPPAGDRAAGVRSRRPGLSVGRTDRRRRLVPQANPPRDDAAGHRRIGRIGPFARACR